MTVLVTGGTGFVGAHSVVALLTAGHRVRLLVRDPARVPATLRPLGIESASIDVVAGDVTDPDTVAAAVHGCTSVLHAASVYSFDTRDHPRMRAVNVRGTEVVLGAAVTAGLDPVVQVSSFGALLPARQTPVTPDAEVGTPRETYLDSKAQADRVARRYQAEGAPVVVTYPLAALGPHDAYLGDQTTRLRNALRGLMPIWPRGGFPVGDVRDVARLHAAVLEPGRGPRRYLGPGRYVDTQEYLRVLRRVTGRALPAIRLPATAMLPVGALTGLVQRVTPVHLPAEYGAIYTCAVARPVDTTLTDQLLDGPTVPFERTVADTVAWLAATDHITPRQAGRLAAPRPAPFEHPVDGPR
ncbi:NAD-dependent epimerase/dehydratase family protein [Salinispora tropica]|uniref:NAD-dependent epimerase/dehydratase n=1 Tax=Salinispora tropica (strain ATCC BAA-916 / DSM 44818 / JCM 13857 / NBRC 105044 / CNB-440) TaxID=369723 RepID=A4X8E6_SALTO|nr:NAD-dependent epimerase/dehydratase family protein [Salinispora tropica]ABP55146.1 NAD-dependent epimerase/dehydratase [Salinispora tropica CNB-440]